MCRSGRVSREAQAAPLESVMPVPAMAGPVVDHQKRFQAAVDVIHNLPKNGSYQPSYKVMLRFYSLYKQAVCGPCTVPRPGFWDPVGRYKWDAWSCLGEMSSNSAMEAYVEEMKKVAQEVIDTMPMNEKTASFFHLFEPLYQVIDDMPRPPDSLLSLTEGAKATDDAAGQEKAEALQNGPQEQPYGPHQDQQANTPEDIPSNMVSSDPVKSEGLAFTSDSESEIYCDSVDSMEQLSNILIPIINGGHGGCPKSSKLPQPPEGRQVGAGQGGEGAEDKRGPWPSRRVQHTGREGSGHSWRERGVPPGDSSRKAQGTASGAGRRGGDGSEDGAERPHDVHLQQQIILALQRLRDDMRSVMDRLEAVERLAATQAQGQQWRQCLQCAAAASRPQERWRPFDLSPPTLLVFLLWPFAAQGLVFLLKRAHHNRMSS